MINKIFNFVVSDSSENLNLFLKHLTDYEKSKIRIFKMRPELGKIKSQMTAAKMCKGDLLLNQKYSEVFKINLHLISDLKNLPETKR